MRSKLKVDKDIQVLDGRTKADKDTHKFSRGDFRFITDEDIHKLASSKNSISHVVIHQNTLYGIRKTL